MATLDAWGEAGQKYKIHEETLAFFRQQKERGARPYPELSVEEAREANLQTSLFYAGDTEFKGSIKEFTVPSVHCPGKAVFTNRDEGRLILPILIDEKKGTTEVLSFNERLRYAVIYYILYITSKSFATCKYYGIHSYISNIHGLRRVFG